MKRWFKLSLLLCVAVIALCGSIVVFAQKSASGQTPLVLEIGQCDQTPCFLGVTPDKTLYRDAATIIAANAQVEAIEFGANCFILARLNARLCIYSSREIIDEMDISLDPSKILQAGEIIARFGSPCYAGSLGDTLTIKYPYMAVFLAMDKVGALSVLRPTSRVIEIRMLGGVAKGCPPIDNQTIFRWHGFSSY